MTASVRRMGADMNTKQEQDAQWLGEQVKRLAEDMADAACASEAGSFVDRQRTPLHRAIDRLVSLAQQHQAGPAEAGPVATHLVPSDETLADELSLPEWPRAAPAPLQQPQDAAPGVNDTKRLEWLQFHGARVAWGNDSEYCSVDWSDRDGSYRTKLFGNWREAIDAAMAGEFKEMP
jgi:hypothetical protein